jgi:membrane protein YdbS with pleckstrin-like domain
MNAAGEKPVFVIKPRYIVSIVFLRSVFFYVFGAIFLSIVSMAFTAAFSGGNDEYFMKVIPLVVAVWTMLYLYFIFGMVPARYTASSYRFYSDRVEFEAGTLFSLTSRSIIYARIIETGCVKQFMQIPRGMGNITLKVAAAGANPGTQTTVLQDNLVMTDIENADASLEKIREIIQKKP